MVVKIVKVNRAPSNPEPPLVLDGQQPKTPYDLIQVEIEGEMIDARPIEFDNEKATKYTTVCPKCGQGVEFEHTKIKFGIVRCNTCQGPEIIAPPSSYLWDPFKAGVLDPQAFVGQMPTKQKGTVAERYALQTTPNAPKVETVDEDILGEEPG